MPAESILVSTWSDGLFHVRGGAVDHELAGRPVRSLTDDGRGGTLAIVDGRSICRRSAGGEWREIAASESPLSCCVAVADRVFAGTDDAQVLRLDHEGVLQRLTGFETTPGRDSWYAGSAIVDGRVLGPPLGVRSITATCDGAAVLANVHVGGIPRSLDGGVTWTATIDIEADVHQVCAHPERPELVIAAAATGLCVSRDGGASWTIEQRGLHAPHCSAVAFGRRDILVSASVDPFSALGAVYRRPVDDEGPLQRFGGGMPDWTEGVVDTDSISTRGAIAAIIDRAGRLQVSDDDGASWFCPIDPLPGASGLHVC